MSENYKRENKKDKNILQRITTGIITGIITGIRKILSRVLFQGKYEVEQEAVRNLEEESELQKNVKQEAVTIKAIKNLGEEIKPEEIDSTGQDKKSTPTKPPRKPQVKEQIYEELSVSGDSDYASSLDKEPEYEKISDYQEKSSKDLTSQSLEQPKEEPIYATVSKEHIEAKRLAEQSKPQIPPKPSIESPPKVPNKTPYTYTTPNAPGVNWETFPGNAEKVMRVNNIPIPKIKAPNTQISVKNMVKQFEEGKVIK